MKKFLMMVMMCLLVMVTGCSSNPKTNEIVNEEPEVLEEVEKEEHPVEVVADDIEEVSINILVPSGSTAMAMAHLASELPELDEGVKCIVEPYVQGSDPLLAAFTSETANVIVAPTNLGATLYQKGVPYQLASTIVWGNLYLISSEPMTIEELSGKTITAFGQGSTPDIVLQTVLKEKGLLDSVEIEYLNSVTDVQSMFAAGEIEIAVIAEPSLSVLKTKVENANLVADFQEEWRTLYDVTSYPQASLFVHSDLIENNPGVVESLLAQVAASVNFANESPNEMAIEANATGLETPEAIIAASVPNSHLIFKTAKEAQDEINLYLEKLYEFDSKTIGGALPDDDFYYLENDK